MKNDEETIAFLRLLGRGEFLALLHDGLRSLESAVSETGKAGEVGIKIKVAPNGGAKRVLSFNITRKLPQTPPAGTYVWTNEAGQFVDADPDQKTLPLRVVPDSLPSPRTLEVHPMPQPVAVGS